jgi:hypothetical protein
MLVNGVQRAERTIDLCKGRANAGGQPDIFGLMGWMGHAGETSSEDLLFRA